MDESHNQFSFVQQVPEPGQQQCPGCHFLYQEYMRLYMQLYIPQAIPMPMAGSSSRPSAPPMAGSSSRPSAPPMAGSSSRPSAPPMQPEVWRSSSTRTRPFPPVQPFQRRRRGTPGNFSGTLSQKGKLRKHPECFHVAATKPLSAGSW